MEAKLSLKTNFFNFFRKIFRYAFFETWLVTLIKKYPGNFILRKLQPNNYLYPARSIRNVKRWDLNFELDISDYQEWLIYYMSEKDSSFLLLKYLKHGDHVFDIGGNIGQTALRMAQVIGNDGRITSFEPFPQTFAKFKKNLSLNPIYESTIVVENMALGDRIAKLKMFKDCSTNSGGNRILHEHVANPTELTEVAVETVDGYIEAHHILKLDFIKIDVEGFELNVLKGAEKALMNLKPRLYIEVNDTNLKEQGGSAKELFLFLEKMKYSISQADNEMPITSQTNITSHIDIYCEPKSIN